MEFLQLLRMLLPDRRREPEQQGFLAPELIDHAISFLHMADIAHLAQTARFYRNLAKARSPIRSIAGLVRFGRIASYLRFRHTYRGIELKSIHVELKATLDFAFRLPHQELSIKLSDRHLSDADYQGLAAHLRDVPIAKSLRLSGGAANESDQVPNLPQLKKLESKLSVGLTSRILRKAPNLASFTHHLSRHDSYEDRFNPLLVELLRGDRPTKLVELALFETFADGEFFDTDPSWLEAPFPSLQRFTSVGGGVPLPRITRPLDEIVYDGYHGFPIGANDQVSVRKVVVDLGLPSDEDYKVGPLLVQLLQCARPDNIVDLSLNGSSQTEKSVDTDQSWLQAPFPSLRRFASVDCGVPLPRVSGPLEEVVYDAYHGFPIGENRKVSVHRLVIHLPLFFDSRKIPPGNVTYREISLFFGADYTTAHATSSLAGLRQNNPQLRQIDLIYPNGTDRGRLTFENGQVVVSGAVPPEMLAGFERSSILFSLVE